MFNIQGILFFLLCCTAISKGQQTDYPALRRALQRDAIQYEKEKGLHSPVLAEAYYKIAMLDFHQKDYSAAKKAFEQELNIRLHLPDTGQNKAKLIKARYNVTVLHQQLGEYKKALTLASDYLNSVLKHYGTKHSETVDAFQLIAGISYQLHRLSPYETYTEKALTIARSLPELNPDKLVNLLILRAGGYIETGDYESGDLLLREALDLQEKNTTPNLTLTAKLYNNLGSLRDNQHRSAEALQYFRKALDIWLEMGAERHPALIWLYDNIGVIHQKMNNFSEAEEYFQKAIDLAKAILGERHIKTAEIMGHLGAALKKENKVAAALQCLYSAISIFQQTLGTSSIEQWFAYQKIAEIYVEQGDYTKAWSLSKKAADLLIKQYGERHPDLARHYLNMARYAKTNKEAVEYLYYLEKCHASNQLPPKEQTKLLLLDKVLFLEFLSEWLSCTKAIQNQPQCEFLIETALQHAQKLLGGAQQASDKTALLKVLHRLYTSILTYYAQKSILEGLSVELWEKAFYVMELSKSVLLSEILTENQTFANIGMPKEWRQAYRATKVRAQYNEEEWFKSELSGNAEDIAYFQAQYKLHQHQVDSMERLMKKQYPNLSFLDKTISKNGIATIRRKLGEKEGLLSYFVSDEAVFLLGITQKDIVFKQVDNECIAQVSAFLPPLFSPDFAETNWKNTFDEFVALSHRLSAALLPQTEFLEGVSQLSILPDGLLSYLPFELLMHRPLAGETDFKKLPYLLKSHSVRYAYSFNTRLKSNRKPINKGFLALAPRYEGNSPYHQPLVAAEAELGWLRTRYVGEFISEKDVGKDNLKRYMQAASVIHLAAHAFAPDSSEAFLLLSDIDTEAQPNASRFMMHEFAALSFDEVDLVVLSACRSGLGNMKRGEGLMSLGRGFAYAGVPAILATLWPLHDKSAEKLMQGFYSYLEKGYTKDEALRQAKLDFLESAGRLHSHPFYWAAPVLWGNSTPIYLTKASYSQKWWYIWAGAGLFVLILPTSIVIIKNRKHKIVN